MGYYCYIKKLFQECGIDKENGEFEIVEIIGPDHIGILDDGQGVSCGANITLKGIRPVKKRIGKDQKINNGRHGNQQHLIVGFYYEYSNRRTGNKKHDPVGNGYYLRYGSVC